MSPDELIAECFACWPALFRTRADVLNHLLFRFDSGFGWRDGALVELESVTDEINSGVLAKQRKRHSEWEGRDRDLVKLGGERLTADVWRNRRERAAELVELGWPRPFADDGAPRQFSGVLPQSCLVTAPDDVRPEWREVLVEAARMLVERQSDANLLGVVNETSKHSARLNREWAQDELRRWGAL